MTVAGGRAYDDPIEQDVPLNRTPDFYTYAAVPLAEARADGEFIVVGWPDGATLRAHVLWLWENRMAGAGVDEATAVDHLALRQEVAHEHRVDGLQIELCS